MIDWLPILAQLVQIVLVVVGATFAVRREVQNQADSLNSEVISLQGRKITLLTDELATANKRIEQLEGAVAVLERRLMARTRRNTTRSN
ncbi:MAG: hypothetical protein ABI670_19675 [Chloroflexota bacterium]